MDRKQNPVCAGGERVYFFDHLKLFLIFCVVLAHYSRVCGSFTPDSPMGFVYITAFSFIMQGFLFISGYFSKNPEKCRKTAVKAFLIPFLVLSVILQSLKWFLMGPESVDLLVPAMALWYLLALFVYRFFLVYLLRIPFLLPLSVGAALLAGTVSEIGAELSLSRIICFFPFFLLGYYTDKAMIEKIRTAPLLPFGFLLALLLLFSYVCAFEGRVDFGFWHLKEGYEAYKMTNLDGMLGRGLIMAIGVLWILVLVRLAPSRPLGRKGALTAMGAATMSVYVFHIGLRYAIKAFGIPGEGGPLTWLILLFLAAASVFLFSRPVFQRIYDRLMEGAWLFCRRLSLRTLWLFSQVPAFLRRS